MQDHFAAESQQVAQDFRLEHAPSVFLPGGMADLQELDQSSLAEAIHLAYVPAESQPAASGTQAQSSPPLVTPTRSATGARSSKSVLVIPIPGFGAAAPAEPQASLDGPTLTVRRWLADGAALVNLPTASGAAPILMLGGDLPLSTWGEPASARATFQYLQSRPWIRLLDPLELASERGYAGQETSPLIGEGIAPDAQTGELASLLPNLAKAPTNSITQAAWQAYQALYQPIFPNSPELAALRRQYAGQLGILLEAARWADAPAEIATCQLDPDLDGQPECLLANENTLAVFELDAGGYLAYLFSVDAAGAAHQWLGPSSQVLVGASPANNWEFSRGAAADPGVYPGAFILSTARFDPNQRIAAQISPAHLLLDDPASGVRKAFNLLPDGLQVQISGVQPDTGFATRLPLLLDPWLRFQPGWSALYQAGEIENGFSWQAGELSPPAGANRRPRSFKHLRRLGGIFRQPRRPQPRGAARTLFALPICPAGAER